MEGRGGGWRCESLGGRPEFVMEREGVSEQRNTLRWPRVVELVIPVPRES